MSPIRFVFFGCSKRFLLRRLKVSGDDVTSDFDQRERARSPILGCLESPSSGFVAPKKATSIPGPSHTRPGTTRRRVTENSLRSYSKPFTKDNHNKASRIIAPWRRDLTVTGACTTSCTLGGMPQHKTLPLGRSGMIWLWVQKLF